MKIKSYDIVLPLIEEASDRFLPLFKLNEANLDVFKQYCKFFDGLIKEFDGQSIEFDIDEIKMTISVKIEVPDMVIERDDRHYFYELIKRTESFWFECSEGGNVTVILIFPSLWDAC